MFDDQEDWSRINFSTKECSSDAKWVKQCNAQRQNKASQSEVDGFKASMMKDAAAGGVDSNIAAQHQAQAELRKQYDKAPAVGDTEKYSWIDESSEEVEVKFKCAEAFAKKDVSVRFMKDKMTVKVKDDVLFDEKLYRAIEASECSWSIVDKTLVVTLSKKDETVWSALVKE